MVRILNWLLNFGVGAIIVIVCSVFILYAGEIASLRGRVSEIENAITEDDDADKRATRAARLADAPVYPIPMHDVFFTKGEWTE